MAQHKKTSTAATKASTASEAPAGDERRLDTVWIALVASVVVLVVLAVFIIQNSARVRINFLGYHGTLSFGVSLLLAALAGSAITILIGSIRLWQLRNRRHSAV